MLEISNTHICGWESAIRGMRNPLNSWKLSDSKYDANGNIVGVGTKDLELMKRLVASGTDHRKFMRMIVVTLDINAPLYFWKEFDTYKIGTVANSCSTMHKIHSKEFRLEDFSTEHLTEESKECLVHTICMLNSYRDKFNETKAKMFWLQMIQLLPSSFNQRRTVMLNYEVLANICKSRRNHKLDEWHTFCDWVEGLPHHELIIGEKYEN